MQIEFESLGHSMAHQHFLYLNQIETAESLYLTMDTKALNPESTCDHMSDKIQRNVKNNQLLCSKLNLIIVFILDKICCYYL